jgi:hypothetical protein
VPEASEWRGSRLSFLGPKASECRGCRLSFLAPKVSEWRGCRPSFLALKASECRGSRLSFLAPEASEWRGSRLSFLAPKTSEWRGSGLSFLAPKASDGSRPALPASHAGSLAQNDVHAEGDEGYGCCKFHGLHPCEGGACPTAGNVAASSPRSPILGGSAAPIRGRTPPGQAKVIDRTQPRQSPSRSRDPRKAARVRAGSGLVR